MKISLNRIVTAMLLAVALYGAFVIYTGLRSIESSLAAFRWSFFALAIALASVNYLLRFLRWEYYLGRLGIRGVGKIDSLLIFLSGFVLTVTPGKVGEVFKSAILHETHSVPIERSAPIVIAERLTDVIGVVALIVVGSLGFPGGVPWALAGGALVAAGLGSILWDRPALALFDWLESRHTSPSIVQKLRHAFESLRVIASPTALAWPIAISIIAWGCEGVALYVLLVGFGTPAPLALSVFFYSTASLAGAIVPVPGGLGVVEAIIREQLVNLGGVAEAPATSSMLLVRLATLWWAVLVGFASVAILKRRHPALLRA